MLSTMESLVQQSKDTLVEGIEYVNKDTPNTTTYLLHTRSIQDQIETSTPIHLTLKEDVRGGCGGRVWDAASVLIHYFRTHVLPEFLDTRHVNPSSRSPVPRWIELGAGTGIVGLAVGALLAASPVPASTNLQEGGPTLPHIYLTDLPCMLPICHDNLVLNTSLLQRSHQTVSIHVAELCWGSDILDVPVPLSNQSTTPIFNLILASDPIYLESAFDLLIDTLRAHSDEHTVILISFQRRRKADDRFWSRARKHFTWKDVTPPVEEWMSQAVFQALDTTSNLGQDLGCAEFVDDINLDKDEENDEEVVQESRKSGTRPGRIRLYSLTKKAICSL